MTRAFSESFHFLDLADGPRFAIVTHPSSQSTGTGVLLCNGGWFAGNWNFNRMYVTLARALAEKGHTVVRFDWYGSGESPGYVDRFQLSKPSGEDVLSAAALLEGSDRIIGAGVCFGAASLISAADRIKGLEGVVLVGAVVHGGVPRTPVRQISAGSLLGSALRPEIARGWFDPYTRRLYLKWFRVRLRGALRRLSPRVRIVNQPLDPQPIVTQLRDLAQTGIRIQFLYGEGDSSLSAFSRPPVAELSAFENVRVKVVPFDVASSSSLGAQQETSRAIAEIVESVTRVGN